MKKTLLILAAGAVLSLLSYTGTAKKNKEEPISIKTTPKVIAGVLSWKIVHHHGKFIDIRIQAVDESYIPTGKLFDGIDDIKDEKELEKKVEEFAKKLAGKHVVVKGELYPKDRKAPYTCIGVKGPEDIQEQKPLDLTGTVTIESKKDARGRSMKCICLNAGGKQYEAAGKQAEKKLLPYKGKMVKAVCYLDGDENCLRIADISEIKLEGTDKNEKTK